MQEGTQVREIRHPCLFHMSALTCKLLKFKCSSNEPYLNIHTKTSKTCTE